MTIWWLVVHNLNGSSLWKTFKSKLKELDFKVEHLAAAHSGRVLTIADLDKSIANIATVTEDICPSEWGICAD